MSSSFNQSDDIDPFKQDSPSSPSPSISPKLAAQIPLPPDDDSTPFDQPPPTSPSFSSPPPPPPREPTPPPPSASRSPEAPSRAYNRNSGFEHAATSVGRYLQQSDWVTEVSSSSPSPPPGLRLSSPSGHRSTKLTPFFYLPSRRSRMPTRLPKDLSLPTSSTSFEQGCVQSSAPRTSSSSSSSSSSPSPSFLLHAPSLTSSSPTTSSRPSNVVAVTQSSNPFAPPSPNSTQRSSFLRFPRRRPLQSTPSSRTRPRKTRQ